MRIADARTIRREEKNLLEDLKSAFQFDAFKTYFKDYYKIELIEISDLIGNDMIAKNNEVLFELIITAKIRFTVILDRKGNLIKVENSNRHYLVNEDENENKFVILDPDVLKKMEEEIVKAIASNISIENLKTMFKDELNLQLLDELYFEDGNITMYNSVPAYCLIYSGGLNLNIFIDKFGKAVDLNFIERNNAKKKINADKSHSNDKLFWEK